MSMPMLRAISSSSTDARTSAPIRVRSMSSQSTTASTTATAIRNAR